MSEELDRRRLIALGLVAGAGLALPRTGRAQPLPSDEGQLLTVLLEAELISVAVVERVLASPHLHRRARTLASRLLAAERVHASALERALRAIGVTERPAPPGTAAALDEALAARHIHQRVSALHKEHDCLDLLLALESMAEGMYYAAMPHLPSPSLQRLAAGLLASEAQHESLLGLLRNPKDFNRAAPYAFVEGFPP
ncbi:MAG TPA: ferritin-like domain-containing protein [Solirubrobacteraceae bacterium]|nr:ferritin-like domain-containing protein [Solirubrobacteraceae bacterium]